METLDPHLIVKILSYLPSKTLVEIRSVRRQWKALIGLNLKSSVKEIELRMDSSTLYHFQFVKPWKTKLAPIQNLIDIFQTNILPVFDPISVTKIKIKTDNPPVLEHIPFYVLKGLLFVGDFCPNVRELNLSHYLFVYAEELARINFAYPNLSTFKVHEIQDACVFANLRQFSIGSYTGKFAQFLSNNSGIVSLTMPLSWGQVDEDRLNRMALALSRLTFLHLISVGDLKTQLTRTLFKYLINLHTLVIENTREYTFNAQAMSVLSDNLRFLPKLRHLSIEHYRSERPLSIIGNGTQQPIYDVLLSCRNLTSLCLKTEVSKPSVVCHAITVAADQSSLECLELEFRGSNMFLEYSPLLQCARTDQFANLKRLTLHHLAKSNVLLLITKKCPLLELLRLNKDELTEDEVSTFVVNRMNIKRQNWCIFRFEIQKSSRWYAVFIRKIMTNNDPPLSLATIKIEMYTTTEKTVADNMIGIVPAYKMWNNETKNILKLFDLVKFSAYTDTKNYLFGNFNY